VTLKMPAFEWVHVQLHQQKGMISLSPPTICNSAQKGSTGWWFSPPKAPHTTQKQVFADLLLESLTYVLNNVF
ncbi:MAG: hypothetical protein E7B90_24570, partial [Escherichia coli]|nr:hypothetical protein [Escherichia coli]